MSNQSPAIDQILKIAVVVHGRFHAFDLARELLKLGHHVTLFTNYPKYVAQRFGIPPMNVRNFLTHGIFTRILGLLPEKMRMFFPEGWLHKIFGFWAAREIMKGSWSVVHVWSGVAEEVFKGLNGGKTFKLLMRGSAHIRTQERLLKEESLRTGVRLECPSPWMIDREEREYAVSDAITVLSTFAYDTFIAEGVAPEKLRLLPLGASLKAFRPSSEVIRVRRDRILSGEPLRVLYVGAVSFRKGMWDFEQIVLKLRGNNFRFRLVGPLAPEVSKQLLEIYHHADVISKKDQLELPAMYAWADIFIFPTIEDGYSIVMAQAAASGLPILATTNCTATDLIHEGHTGWVLPIRSPDAFIERLIWCADHRSELANMVHKIYYDFKPRDWSDVAKDFIQKFSLELKCDE